LNQEAVSMWKSFPLVVACLAAGVLPTLAIDFDGFGLRRGDVNGDQTLNVADAQAIQLYLYFGTQILCLDTADVNDDGLVLPGDATSILSYVYSGGDPPAPPFPGCGKDTSWDALFCIGSNCPQRPASRLTHQTDERILNRAQTRFTNCSHPATIARQWGLHAGSLRRWPGRSRRAAASAEKVVLAGGFTIDDRARGRAQALSQRLDLHSRRRDGFRESVRGSGGLDALPRRDHAREDPWLPDAPG
jgi:hypothetical protein